HSRHVPVTGTLAVTATPLSSTDYVTAVSLSFKYYNKRSTSPSAVVPAGELVDGSTPRFDGFGRHQGLCSDHALINSLSIVKRKILICHFAELLSRCKDATEFKDNGSNVIFMYAKRWLWVYPVLFGCHAVCALDRIWMGPKQKVIKEFWVSAISCLSHSVLFMPRKKPFYFAINRTKGTITGCTITSPLWCRGGDGLDHCIESETFTNTATGISCVTGQTCAASAIIRQSSVGGAINPCLCQPFIT
ncbi:hypothetical protein J6590_096264, partial [Homalodisca vitripennis]